MGRRAFVDARCWGVQSASCVPACVPAYLPVPVPLARLSMPDINSSKVIRPASSSWGDTGIPRRCHPVWYFSVYLLYSVILTRISGIGFPLHSTGVQVLPCLRETELHEHARPDLLYLVCYKALRSVWIGRPARFEISRCIYS